MINIELYLIQRLTAIHFMSTVCTVICFLLLLFVQHVICGNRLFTFIPFLIIYIATIKIK